MTLNANRTPVASLERLNELGLDPVLYGSCSATRRVEIEGKGRVLVNRGCAFYHECKDASVPMPDPTPDKMRPRPRMYKTRIIKPAASGRGDTMRENYCACHQWHADLKHRDGNNQELTEVCGGEGDTYVFRGTKEERRLDGTIAFKPDIRVDERIPCFPDPLEAAALGTDVATAAIKKSANEDRRQRRRDARLGVSDEEASTAPVEVDPEDVHRAFSGTGPPKP